MIAHHLPTIVLSFGVLALFQGCNPPEVATYQVAKEDRQAEAKRQLAAMGASSQGAAPAAANREITWKAPSNWQEQPSTSMRIGSFLIQDEKAGHQADLSISAFPGDAGGDLPNVNRWRGQIQLEPLAKLDSKNSTRLKSGPHEFIVVEMLGKAPPEGKKSPTMILAAILHHKDRAWFFKMMGDQPLVQSQKKPFEAFLKSVQFAAPQQAEPHVHNHHHHDHEHHSHSHNHGHPEHPHEVDARKPATSQVKTAAPSTEKSGSATWKAPAHWQAQPLSAMRKGSWKIEKAGKAADVSIISLAGLGGGVLPNVNMWRSQLGQPGIQENQLEDLTEDVRVGGRDGVLVDMKGERAADSPGKKGEAIRIVVAMIPSTDETWFFKLSGDALFVESELGSFRDFLKTVRF
jgi:ABC-type nickel/cobalt efflux system permease component RcnA